MSRLGQEQLNKPIYISQANVKIFNLDARCLYFGCS